MTGIAAKYPRTQHNANYRKPRTFPDRGNDRHTATMTPASTALKRSSECRISDCRLCGKPFFPGELLRYAAMPAMAQHLLAQPGDDSVELRLRQCSGCGLAQLDGPPVPYYREVIRAAAFSAEMGEFRRKQFREWLKRHGLSGRKVLECGCGAGEYLRLMAEAGADARGVEFGEANVEKCLAAGLRVEKTYFEDGGERLSGAPFDGFFILNYLEHLPNLGDYLRGIASNLADGAAGLVEVPNFDMMLKNRTFAEITSDHLYYFTEQTLRTAMEIGGFEAVASRAVYHGYMISMEVRKRSRLDLGSFEEARAELSERLNDLVGRHGAGRCAVWGASHQAFAVLALAGLHGKLRCVIDSAPFKQGKLTPATHIPIVAPDAVAPGALSALVVMAGGYSDEVAGLARRRFGPGVELFVLRENGLRAWDEKGTPP